MYRLVFYVPDSYLESVKSALYSKGAGSIGKYDHCCFQVRGEGEFRPLEGSNPYIGNTGEVQKAPEIRVEMVCSDERVREALNALVEAHPYEEPAYSACRIKTLNDLG
ncbi:MAG: NGG1p interacting factor NIF3 [Chitinivibrionales bacterium]